MLPSPPASSSPARGVVAAPELRPRKRRRTVLVVALERRPNPLRLPQRSPTLPPLPRSVLAPSSPVQVIPPTSSSGSCDVPATPAQPVSSLSAPMTAPSPISDCISSPCRGRYYDPASPSRVQYPAEDSAWARSSPPVFPPHQTLRSSPARDLPLLPQDARFGTATPSPRPLGDATTTGLTSCNNGNTICPPRQAVRIDPTSTPPAKRPRLRRADAVGSSLLPLRELLPKPIPPWLQEPPRPPNQAVTKPDHWGECAVDKSSIQAVFRTLFYVDHTYLVAVCRRCRSCFATGPAVHLAARHEDCIPFPRKRYPRRVLVEEEATFLTSQAIVPRSLLNRDDAILYSPWSCCRPIPHLPVNDNSLLCLLCPQARPQSAGSDVGTGPQRPYICGSDSTMKKHLKAVHEFSTNQGPGRPHGGSRPIIALSPPVVRLAASQSYFRNGNSRIFFEVDPSLRSPGGPVPVSPRPRLPCFPGTRCTGAAPESADDLQSHLAQELDRFDAEDISQRQVTASSFTTYRTAESARWLEVTEWVRFAKDHPLVEIKALTILPRRATATAQLRPRGDKVPVSDARLLPPLTAQVDAILSSILDSFERVVQRARSHLASGELNAFDQLRMNSFYLGHSKKRPFLFTLAEKTWVRYVTVSKRLLYYVYRLAWLKVGPPLHFALTPEQSQALRDLVVTAERYQQLNESLDSIPEGDAEDSREGSTPSQRFTTVTQRLRDELDNCCLVFFVSLFDQQLFGDIYDSVVVGFLAAIAIEAEEEVEEPKQPCRPLPLRYRFANAVKYSPLLATLIKISQLMVGERAILAAERKEVKYPAHALEEMYKRFMVSGSRSPFCWIIRLKGYSRAISDNTTTLGEIEWRENDELVLYRETRFTMTQLRDLVHTELEAVYQYLATIMLVDRSDPEAFYRTVPNCHLSSILDNPANGSPGFSFLNHPENKHLHGQQRWLLNRLTSIASQRHRFRDSTYPSRWRFEAVAEYLGEVDRFLQSLLLLTHIVSGQPARGTEIASILFENPTASGLTSWRNIFVEDGLVSFVTYYHKGLNLTGSPKIIHRYLPRALSEVVVYYLWLVVPFIKQLIRLSKIPNFEIATVPYLWGLIQEQKGLKRKQATSSDTAEKELLQRGSDPWNSRRLTGILTESFARIAQTKVTLQLWRHLSIAISRRHLRQAKFHRNFAETTSTSWNDLMAAHDTRLAASLYGRTFDEAPGHILSAKTEYRRISQEWHTWFGVGEASKRTHSDKLAEEDFEFAEKALQLRREVEGSDSDSEYTDSEVDI